MRKILIYRIGQLGDTIVALPSMWAIRKFFPSAQITLLSDHHQGSSYVPSRNVLPSKGLIDSYISYQANENGATFTTMLRMLPRLRRENFDTIVYLAPRRRTPGQILRDLGFFRLIGMTRFIGHRNIKLYPRAKSGEPLPELEHEADHLLYRISRSNIPVPPPGQGSMDLGLEEKEVREAEAWVRAKGIPEGSFLIGFGVGSNHSVKIWPQERFAEVGQHLIKQLGGYPIIFGGPGEKPLGDNLVAHWQVGANAAGALNVRQAAAALSLCRMYIGNDTGTMHLAAAVGTQCVAVFSARDWPGVWYPYGRKHVVLRRRVPCEGCMLETCKERQKACLDQITAVDVINACHEALNKDGS